MKALSYQIYLCQPALFTQPDTGEPNSSVTYDFIPGSVVRGALIAAFRKNGAVLDLQSEPARSLFFDNQVFYLNAYLAHPNDHRRMLPCPSSWMVQKDLVDDPTAPVYDFAVQPQAWEHPAKAPRGAYFWRGAESIHLASAEIEERVHNVSADRNRKLEGQSQVFRYEVLSAGQLFTGAILSQDDGLLNQVKPLLLKTSFRMGGAKTNAYGHVEIRHVSEPFLWDNLPGRLQASPEEPVALLCLSDVILPGPYGQSGIDWKWNVGFDPSQSFYRLRLVGGFDRTWGLPRVQQWAISAGSVFIFPPEARPVLEKFQEQGIGDRRAEGFGRIVLDFNSSPVLNQSSLPAADQASLHNGQPIPLSPLSDDLARRLAKRQLQQAIDHYLARRVAQLTRELINSPDAVRSLPKSSQLMRARLSARRAWETGQLTEITSFFDHLSELSRRSWRDARMDGVPFETWIRNQIDQRKSFSPIPPATMAGVAVEVEEAVRDEMIARLIEGVLDQAAKVARRREEDRDVHSVE